MEAKHLLPVNGQQHIVVINPDVSSPVFSPRCIIPNSTVELVIVYQDNSFVVCVYVAWALSESGGGNTYYV